MVLASLGLRIDYVVAIVLLVIALIIELPIVPVTAIFPCENSTSTQSTFSISWYDSLTCYYFGIGTMYGSGFQSCYYPSGLVLSVAVPC